jgi:hypothetical protein
MTGFSLSKLSTRGTLTKEASEVSDPLISIMNEDTEERKRESRELVKKTGNILNEAKVLVIEDDEKFHFASDILQAIKGLQKEIDAHYDPAIKKAHETHKAILEAKKKQSEPLKQAERILKSKIVQYHDEQAQKRQEEERKRQEELRKKEEERRLNEAIETGDESVLEEPVVIPEVKIEDTTKHKGISYSTIWKFRVVDKAKVPEEYKIIDEVKVGQVVRAMKENTSIPGIEAYPEKIARSGG